MNYYIAPRSGEKSHKNFESTIKNGVPLSRIQKYLTQEEIEILSQEEVIYSWGNREGTKSAWKRMNIGDTVLFYARKEIVITGEVYFKKHDPELALSMWPADEKGNPWEYTFFLRDLQFISIPIETFNQACGYKPNFIVQGFIPLKEERVANIAKSYGSVENMLSLFYDKDSVELPSSSDNLYINLPKDLSPIIVKDAVLTPKDQYHLTSKTVKKSKKKIDYIAKNIKDVKTGNKGESIVFEYEIERLKNEDRADLAEKVERVSSEDDSLGYDILSYDTDGSERYIEVKATTIKSKDIGFHISSNEFKIGQANSGYFIYFVEDIDCESPQITIIKNPIDENKFSIEPDGYVFTASRS